MSRKLHLALILAVGFLGGMLSSGLRARIVHAQQRSEPTGEVRAQRFVLVNARGAEAGAFGFDKYGTPEIVLLDADGHVTWSTKLRTERISH